MKQPLQTHRQTQRQLSGAHALLLCGLGLLLALPAGSQTAPAATKTEPTALSLPDRLAQGLESLSQRLKVAFVVEGEPFPQPGDTPFPVLDDSLSPDQAVKKAAERFDYDFVRHDNVYILTKRYTQPGDLPDVTPEECRIGLSRAPGAFPIYSSNVGNTPDGVLLNLFLQPSEAAPGADKWVKMNSSLPLSALTDVVQHSVWMTALQFYYQTFLDRVAATQLEMGEATPADPLFQWKPIGRTPAFGYETADVDLVPLSNAERAVLARYGSPLPRPHFRLRTDLALPTGDPTAPTLLSEQEKRYLNDLGNSASVISLSAAVARLNKRTPGVDNYDVDSNYSAKHVILAGADQVSSEQLMQALADVYGLQVRRSGEKRILSTPDLINPATAIDMPRALLSVIPAPIHRAFRLHTAPVAGAHGVASPSLADYEKRGIAVRNKLLQFFRYLAEPQIPYDSEETRALSRLGERANNLFILAQTARAYTDLCGAADCPVPPYLVDSDTFARRVTLQGWRGVVNGSWRMRLLVTYLNPKTHTPYGPFELINTFPSGSSATAVPTNAAH